MKKHVQVSLLNLLCMFIFIMGCHGLDPYYESCVPKDCGDGLNINYPFYVRGLQELSCGYPGFELQCDVNGSPILETSAGNSYLVKEINYDTKVMRLALNTPNITCLSAVKNITLDPGQFVLDGSSSTALVFLTNCSKLLSEDLTRYRINGSCNPDVDELVMLKDDANLINGSQICSNVVMMPVQRLNVGEGRSELVDGGNYAEMVQRGFLLRWIVADCGVCERSGGRCGFNITVYQFRCYCPGRPHSVSCPVEEGNKMRQLVISFSTGGATLLLAVIILCSVMKIKQKRKTTNHVSVENFLKNHEFLAPKRYTYSQVKRRTNSFKLKLGEGGFGTVHKGTLNNGKLVAVKVLSKLKGNGEDFINEVASVGRTSHVNIVTLLGFCCDGHQKALIYEFMPNGSLDRFIYCQEISTNSPLGWEKLYQIAIGVARGLEYLHSGCNTRILHFDIKPHNILLDETLCPKISDFGLAKLSHENKSIISMSHMRGTPGYIAPELFSRNFGHVSHKSDVYSYGMMILEMVGKRKNIEVEADHTSEIYFPHWIYKTIEVDEEHLEMHGITSDEENDMARKMIIVGLWCIQTNPLSRPTITKVLEMFEDDLASLEIPPKPYLSSPSRFVDSTTTS